jgi:hypothetical protein
MQGQLAELRYTHDAMIDVLISNPMISQNQLAAHFGYSPPWISRILRSDSFREALARRKAEVVDPLILQTLEAQFESLVERSLEVLQDKLNNGNPSADVALKALDIGSRALGYGAKQAGVTVNQQFVVAMPQKAASGDEWLSTAQRHPDPLP